MPNHVVLLGDSIFDNASYVPGEDAVIDQLRAELPAGWKATLLARDGDVIADVARQLEKVPADATHLVISVGGNDALLRAGNIDAMGSVDEMLAVIGEALAVFQADYQAMLEAVGSRGLETVVCTIYDRCPFDEPTYRALLPLALRPFNECIIAEAGERDIAVIELRDICTEEADYSTRSPIEPSNAGGLKIVAAMVRQLS